MQRTAWKVTIETRGSPVRGAFAVSRDDAVADITGRARHGAAAGGRAYARLTLHEVSARRWALWLRRDGVLTPVALDAPASRSRRIRELAAPWAWSEAPRHTVVVDGHRIPAYGSVDEALAMACRFAETGVYEARDGASFAVERSIEVVTFQHVPAVRYEPRQPSREEVLVDAARRLARRSPRERVRPMVATLDTLGVARRAGAEAAPLGA